MKGGSKKRLVHELMLALTELRNVSDQVDQAVSDRLGLNRTDARCLACLIVRGPMPAGELAAAAGLTPSALTFAVDRLTQAGYAERAQDPGDRRRVLVRAADRAVRFAEQAWSETIAESERQLAKYTAPQLELLTGFVREHIQLQRRHASRIRDETD